MKLKKYKSQRSDDLSNKIKSYSALTGAFLLTAGSAQSQIIYTDVDPDTAIIKATYDIDLDHDGIIDFKIQQWTTYGTASHAADLLAGNNNANRAMGAVVSFNYIPLNYALNLPAGNPIGPGGPFLGFATFNVNRLAKRQKQASYISSGAPPTYHIWTGGFFTGKSGFVGVEFNTNGNTYYGWIEVAIDSLVDSVVVKGYAYEATPNTYIIAGAGLTTDVKEKQSSINVASVFYPNPVSNGTTSIVIEAKQNSDLKLDVMNGMGQILVTENRKITSGNNIIELNVNSLEEGTYFVRLMQGDKTYFRKILVSK